jgi:hypothetical protein
LVIIMLDSFTTQHLLLAVNAAIVITIIEVLVLIWLHRHGHRGVAASYFVITLCSGLCLMLAVRSVLVSSAAFITGLWLIAAGAAHLTDFWRRWK